MSYSVGHIDLKIWGFGVVEELFFTSFYGNPRVECWRVSRKLLEHIVEGRRRVWFCGGDFNKKNLPEEMRGWGLTVGPYT